MDKIIGQVITKKAISGSVDLRKIITGNIQIASQIPIHDKYEEYEGSYNVVPLIREQILPTKKRSMEDDLTVEAIHYLEAPNPEGGKTVTIGFE